MAIIPKRMTQLEERKRVMHAAKKASSSAIRVSRALQLPIQFVKGNKIVQQQEDGTITELKKVTQVKSHITLTKGITLCLQPKE